MHLKDGFNWSYSYHKTSPKLISLPQKEINRPHDLKGRLWSICFSRIRILVGSSEQSQSFDQRRLHWRVHCHKLNLISYSNVNFGWNKLNWRRMRRPSAFFFFFFVILASRMGRIMLHFILIYYTYVIPVDVACVLNSFF